MTKQERIIQIKDAMQALIANDRSIRVEMIAKKLNDKKIRTITGKIWTDFNALTFINERNIGSFKQRQREREEEVKNAIRAIVAVDECVSSQDVADQMNAKNILTLKDEQWDRIRAQSYIQRHNLRKKRKAKAVVLEIPKRVAVQIQQIEAVIAKSTDDIIIQRAKRTIQNLEAQRL